MAEQVGISSSAAEPFEYELFEGDPDHLKTVVSQTHETSPWIDPEVIKLKHRIGRGNFGDVWLATHHRSTEDYDEYHEVAVKMLFPVKEDQISNFRAKFEDAFTKCQGLHGVCFVHGMSVINGRICIVMKFYDGSIGDRMAHLKEGKLALSDVTRYGIDLAQGILKLHSKGILVLNLKPFNFLLNEDDQAILGDFGIASLLFGISLSSLDVLPRLGTSNYMAPEQWEPDVRGPVSFQTDSWGFGCSILEMFSGFHPWFGKSPKEIYHLVVIKQEKPKIPSGLPPLIENIIKRCFEYDFRSRPLFSEILHAFESYKNQVHEDTNWIGLASKTVETTITPKYQHRIGDIVRSRKLPNSGKLENMEITEGTIVGGGDDGDGFVLVRVHGVHEPFRVHSSTLERMVSGFAAGDWVRIREEDNNRLHSPIGILHSVDHSGQVTAGFLGKSTLWTGHLSELQMAKSYCTGQFVRLKSTISNPRFEWPREPGGFWITGRLCQILPNGCLVTRFPSKFVLGREVSSYLADPAEVEEVNFKMCTGMMKKYQHLEDYHWSVRPLVLTLGILTALKTSLFIGNSVFMHMSMRRRKVHATASSQTYEQLQDGQNSSNPAWIRHSVANIFFKEGGPATPGAVSTR